MKFFCTIEWLGNSPYVDVDRFHCMVAFLAPVFGGKYLGDESPQTAVFEKEATASVWEIDFLNRSFAEPWLKAGAQLVLFTGSRCCGVATIGS